MARTNIDIDEALIERVMRRYDFRTKREAVEGALRNLDVEPMTREEILELEGMGWDGDLDGACGRPANRSGAGSSASDARRLVRVDRAVRAGGHREPAST